MTNERTHIAAAAAALDDRYAALSDHLHGQDAAQAEDGWRAVLGNLAQSAPSLDDLLSVATDDEAAAISACAARLRGRDDDPI